MRRMNSEPSIHHDQGKHPSNCLQKGVRKLHGNDLLDPFSRDRSAKPQVRACAREGNYAAHMSISGSCEPLSREEFVESVGGFLLHRR